MPDSTAEEPIPACAFLCYDKDETPKGDHPKYLAKQLKKFLAEIREDVLQESSDRHQLNDQGETVSLCNECFSLVIQSSDEDAVAMAEATHTCQ